MCVCVTAEITLLAALLSQSSAYCSKQDVYVVAKCLVICNSNLGNFFVGLYKFIVSMFLLISCQHI